MASGMRAVRRYGLATVVVVLLSSATAPAASAQVAAENRVTFFHEPGSKFDGVTVIHPQTDVSARTGGAVISAGYDMDVVTGATPAVFSRATAGAPGVDAITAPTRFDDIRQTARGGLAWEMATVGLSAGYSYGWESDYKSHTLAFAARGDFLERNFTLNLAYTRNFDSVCDRNNAGSPAPFQRRALSSSDQCFEAGQTETVSRGLDIDTFEPSLTWTATPRLLLQAGGMLQILKGFQSSPYRRVLVGSQGQTPQERLPEHRQRYALFGRVHYAIPAVRAAILLAGRAYRDTWDVLGATGELTFRKYIATPLIVQVRGRVHQQTGAVFYRNALEYETLGPPGAYWTGDRELSPLRTLLGSFKIAYISRNEQDPDAFLQELELNIKFSGLLYNLEDGAPNADRKFALIGQLGLALRF